MSAAAGRLAVVIALLCASTACAEPVHRSLVDVDRNIKAARDLGAERCAPVELAMAVTHREFVDQELAEGDLRRAREELEVADASAREALRLSPKGRCSDAEPGVPNALDADGDGFTDDRDQCPKEPEDYDGFGDDDGCPDADNDADGIADDSDQCPNEAEDIDQFEDENGCPDLDNDGDGIADLDDQCPAVAEDHDTFEDADGCPDCDNDRDGVPECPEPIDQCPDKPAKGSSDGCPQYKSVKLTEKKIELNEAVYFGSGNAVILKRSHQLLDEVAQVLKDNTELKIRIEGHTDSRGRDSYNMRLSQKRADAVREYLVSGGIASDRLISKGFGETQPIADNRTRAGREENRRVEFVIVGR